MRFREAEVGGLGQQGRDSCDGGGRDGGGGEQGGGGHSVRDTQADGVLRLCALQRPPGETGGGGCWGGSGVVVRVGVGVAEGVAVGVAVRVARVSV